MLSLASLFLLVGQSQCGPVEGTCRAVSAGKIQRYASGYWQNIDPGIFQCVNGSLIVGTTSSTEAGASPATQSRLSTSAATESSAKGRVGAFECMHTPVPVRSDPYGVASYTPGGRMASTYKPGAYIFRCNEFAQPDVPKYYVAVWTRYDPSLTAQPMPQNCNQSMQLTNPHNGRTATAKVIDRCQSCVGVDHQTSDPTTPDSLVNGATVDLSPALFKYLYNEAPDGVYDVEYDGPVYSGSLDGPPDKLDAPNCACLSCNHTERFIHRSNVGT